MYKILKIDQKNYPNLFSQEVSKYVVLSDDNTIIGISAIDNNSDKNKIKIKVVDHYQGNGYGKIIFKETLKEFVKLFGITKLKFEINQENENFINILLQEGGIQTDYKSGKITYILPLGKWCDENA